MQLKIIFLSIFITVIYILNLIMEYEKNSRIDSVLELKTDQINLEYKVIYNNYKTLSKVIFNTIVDTEEVKEFFSNRDRESLKKHLGKDYESLVGFSVKQLHFHLPNNDSFLRMHRVDRYGDNLAKDRLTVKYVNETKKEIDGFEEGKVFNGFRFVYPLFDNDNYLGSVEISFSALFFIKEIMNSYDVYSNFYIKEDLVLEKLFGSEKKNYKKSPIQGYLNEVSIENYLMTQTDRYQISEYLKEEILKKIRLQSTFSLFDKNRS
ncbi:MAG: hypothetical protein JXQ66_01565, partial [Campylobacterales bacterium]|nr:hypothetical protein [Campylobacterales bacterium]